MVDVKPVTLWVSKWKARAGAASADYTTQAIAAASKYATAAAAAGPNWNQGVQEAQARNAYSTGVQKSGAAGYSNGVQTKGSVRYAGGITAGEPNYNTGAGKVAGVLNGIQLSAKQVAGSPANLQRVAEIANALHAAKVAGSFQ